MRVGFANEIANISSSLRRFLANGAFRQNPLEFLWMWWLGALSYQCLPSSSLQTRNLWGLQAVVPKSRSEFGGEILFPCPPFQQIVDHPHPNKNGSYGIKGGGSYAIKFGVRPHSLWKSLYFKGFLRHTTPHFTAYFGGILFANMGGGGGQTYFHYYLVPLLPQNI